MFGCLTFGRMHVAAWYFDFSSPLETALWRVASFWCTVFAFFAFIARVALLYVTVPISQFPHITQDRAY
jgi:hypothetical protein